MGLTTNATWILSIVGSVAIVAFGLHSAGADEAKAFQLQILWLTPLYAFSIYALSWQRGVIASLFKTKLLIKGGEMSYALYLTHFIVLIILRRVFPAESVAEAVSPVRLLVLLGYLVAMGAIAMLTYRFVEEPGRLWMKSWLKKPSKQNAETLAKKALAERI